VRGRLAGIGVTADAFHITRPDPSGSGRVRANPTGAGRRRPEPGRCQPRERPWDVDNGG
jgi:hypothetical protein